jgi:AcrR family transcriptional regulator
MRARTEDTLRAIMSAALVTFCKHGYASATLEEIGAEVGLTRGAVLHHFKSKSELLGAVVQPFRAALAQLLATADVADPATEIQRDDVLNGFADLFLAHRGAVRLLTNDVSARVALGLVDQWPMPPARLVTLLAGSRPIALTQVQVTAAIGAMIAPIASVWLDLDDAAARDELIRAASAVLDNLPSGADIGSGLPAPGDHLRLTKAAGQ